MVTGEVVANRKTKHKMPNMEIIQRGEEELSFIQDSLKKEIANPA
jgi:hypothetical protein